MKHLTTIILFFILCVPTVKAQQASVEKSVWGIQTLMLPLSVYNEAKLTNSIALRSELAWGFGWTSGSYIDNSAQWAAVPYLGVEPRWYYNLNRRTQRGKRIDGNSGNYLSLYSGFQPGFGITSKNVDLFPSIYIVPTYGLKRNIGRYFNFEAALGIGYGWEFEKYTSPYSGKHRNTDSGTVYNIRLTFGYVF